MTEAERALWRKLRARQLAGAKFRRQAPIDRFVVDFLCEYSRLIVELDGGQHAKDIAHDVRRTSILETHGYRVLRFWNNDVLNNMAGVLQTIEAALKAR